MARLDAGQKDTDPDTAALYAEPFIVTRPKTQTGPFVFASPHSGRHYPASFVARSRLKPLALPEIVPSPIPVVKKNQPRDLG